MSYFTKLSLLSAFTVGLLSHSLCGAIYISIEQVDSNVEINWSGSVKVSELDHRTQGAWHVFTPDNGDFFFASGTTDSYIMRDIKIGASFGATSSQATSDSFSGSDFGMSNEKLYLPSGYSGGTILGRAVFNSQTLESLGLTPGSKKWDLDLGDGTLDRLTLTVITDPTATVPEPTATILLTGLASLAVVALRRPRQKIDQ